ncbi:TonB-dependent receptor domain-containing protein [Croceicoccus hydrothermalis]|uniref:TonB-dependent receptor domain-containing protein n=1 Tax=Croceicoccus hydrothermalis TaxID=2867964 RepID=UPI001EFB1FD6|nr:TonB-dependent receptor [Croceicoccus hydrothermalis]
MQFTVPCRSQTSLLALSLAFVLPAIAHAQDVGLPEDSDGDAPEASVPVANDQDNIVRNEIVVVGTLIRGTEAVGSQTISVGEDVIDQRGATTTNEILSLIPQISNTFNSRAEGDPRGAVSGGISITRPNLRRLPGFQSTSGATTLVLVDGFRIAPVGVGQASVDVDVIPTAILSGVDALTDGGTSLYGADAVAGVLNFRTKRSFEGLEVDLTYGLGDTVSSFDEYAGSITAGKSWATGNAYLSLGYAHRDRILNGEIDYALPQIFDPDGTASFTGAQCPDPVGGTNTYVFVQFGTFQGFTTNPAVGGGFNAVGETCDEFSAQTFMPENERYSAYGAVSQQFGDVDLRVTGYYTKRDQNFGVFPRGFTTAAQPQPDVPPGAIPFVTRVTVDAGTSFSFSPNSASVNPDFEVGFETYGITPEVSLGLFGDFEARVTSTFGGSDNYQRRPEVNGNLAQSLVNSGDFDPFNIAAADPNLVGQVLDFEDAIDTEHQFFAVRGVVDGPLFRLPGGDARIAIGAEYLDNTAKNRTLSGAVGAIDNEAFREATQNTKAVFAQLNLPVSDFLDVAASVRHDEYSDFGTTTNPNFGASFTPVDGFRIYGQYNTSFNAPTALDLLASSTGRITPPIYINGRTPEDPFNEYMGGERAFLLEGADSGLQPQEAESFSIGVELEPTSTFRVGALYYNIDFTNVLGAVNSADLNTFRTNPDLYYYSPSQELYESLLSEVGNGALLLQQTPDASTIGLIVDRRVTNLSSAQLQGMDFHAYLDIPKDFGVLSFGVNGNIPFRIDLENAGTVSDIIDQAPDYTAATFAALNSGGFSTRLTVNITGPIDDVGTDFTGMTASNGSFVQANLFLGYEFGEDDGYLNGTSVRLIVDNILDEKPEIIRRGNRNAVSYSNSTLGRVFRLGLTKRFF